MISENFVAPFNWLVESGVEVDALEAHFDRLYEANRDVFDLHILAENSKKPEARDFSNIRMNAMMKLVVMDVLTDMLGMDQETKARLCRATVVPNWDLHFTKRPEDYDEGVPEQLRKAGENLEYDHDLVFAAGPDFFNSDRVDESDVTAEELLMLLVSDLVDEREIGKPTIMDVDSHLAFKRVERADLGQDYWKRERAKDHVIMRSFFPMIAPEMLPTIILDKLIDKIK